MERWRRCKKWNAIVQRIPTARWRSVTRGSLFVAARSSRCWVQLLKRASLASATASRQRYAPLICNTRGRSRRLLTGIEIEQTQSFWTIRSGIAVVFFALFPLLSFSKTHLSPHDVDGENAALMTCKEVIDEVANNRIRLVTKLCHNPADERTAARMPFQVNRTVKIPGAVYFRPPMRTSGLFRPDFDEAEFLFQERIGHDLIA